MRKLAILFTGAEHLPVYLEIIFANSNIVTTYLLIATAFSFQGILYPDDQFFHAEWFADIIIAAHCKAFYHIFCLCFGSQENNGYFFIQFADLIGNCKTIFVGKHHIKDTNVG